MSNFYKYTKQLERTNLNYYKKIKEQESLIEQLTKTIKKLNKEKNEVIENLQYNISLINSIRNTINEKNKIIEDLKKNNKNTQTQNNLNVNLTNIFTNIKNLVFGNKIKCLNKFYSINNFLEETEELFGVQKWEIRNIDDKLRIKALEKYDYWQYLKNKVIECKFVEKQQPSDEFILSLFDSYKIMYEALKIVKNEISELENNEVRIIQEYNFIENNNSRADYIILFRNQIYIIEFSKINEENKYQQRKNKKSEQVKQYEEFLKTEINANIKSEIIIESETFIYSYDNNKKINEEAINTIAKRIKQRIKDSNISALSEIIKSKNFN